MLLTLGRAGRDVSGQSLVELSLVLPLFALMLLATTVFGQLAYDSIEISNAARAGVAYGAQSTITAADFNGMRQAALDDSPDLASLQAPPVAQSNCFCANATSTAVACSAGESACPGSHLVEYVQVNTSAVITPAVHYPGFPATFTLTGQAIMRVAQ